MSYVIQARAQVQILEPNHEFNGRYGYVTAIEGDSDSLDDPIPGGWVEVHLESGFHELFREEHVVPAHLTM